MYLLFLSLFCLLSPPFSALESQPSLQKRIEDFFLPSDHTKNFAVLVSSSRDWKNYRHTVDVLLFYHHVKRLGIPDSNIILMIPDVIACKPNNSIIAEVIGNTWERKNLYDEKVEIDYRGYDVTSEMFVRVLMGLVPPEFPRNKHLLSDEQSNVLLYMTGHGGDGSHGGYLKFQDRDIVSSTELSYAIEVMHQKRRYKELLLISDTCQGASMYSEINRPNVLATSSSILGEESYSHQFDPFLEVHINDAYAYNMGRFLTNHVKSYDSNVSMADYLSACPKERCKSTTGVRTDLYPKPVERVRVTDFFGSRRFMLPLNAISEMTENWESLPSESESRRKKWQF